ncbi:hypothetical protein NPIL_462201 [Nephila pilipes]|uniref:Uncharacterized protein n=1 Tax=Nephila pilipes TaxID=299642 RepID=A0A8X6JBY9_NEPPI|nr:hypothetical protein NPIL_462201 [Nephila pilipes]
MVKFAFPGYNVFLLKKGRKVASGILVGVKNITSNFEIIKPMGVNNIIINAAKKLIPRGRQKVFSCFWNGDLVQLKEECDELSHKVQEMQDPQVVIDWRRRNATLKREINGESELPLVNSSLK